jgi:MFS family permease
VAIGGGRLWHAPEFLKLWAGSSISSLGSQITVLALPLTAVLLFGAGPAETGLLTAAGVAPTLLFGLPAGAWVDRLPRRHIRIAADLASALVIVSVPIAALFGVLQFGQLYLAAFLAGTCAVGTRLSVLAMLPSLVGRENLLEANTKTMLSFSVAQIAGPSLAGILVQAFSAPLALVADAASFVVSAVAVWWVRLDEPRPTVRRQSIRRDVVEGVRWLRGQPILFRLTLSIGLANLAWYGVQAVIVVYATRDLGISPAALGLALGTIGPASLVGALVAGSTARRLGLGPTLVVSLSGEALSRVVLVAAGGSPQVAALCIAVSQAVFGFIAPLWDVNANSLRQSATPERLLGRVTAASMFIGTGMAPVGALLAGWIGEVAGMRAALVETTLVTLIALVILVRSPVPRVRDTTALRTPASGTRGAARPDPAVCRELPPDAAACPARSDVQKQSG